MSYERSKEKGKMVIAQTAVGARRSEFSLRKTPATHREKKQEKKTTTAEIPFR